MTPRDTPRAGVHQLRVVVKADDFEEALTFYRDVLGMPEEESYEGDGGARVAILGAGRATLELSNPAQVELIDRVEAEGKASERIRIALEVDDTVTTTDTLTAAGATLIAAPRETPWRSLNSRIHAPANLQVTLFQELDHPTPVTRDTTPPEPRGPFNPRITQQLEGALIAALAIVGTVAVAPQLWWFPLAVFLAFDLSALGYLHSTRTGAASYNAIHTYAWPAALGAAALLTIATAPGVAQWLALIGLAWAFHVGIDRMLGYGLKHPHSFTHTHLGRIGRDRSTGN